MKLKVYFDEDVPVQLANALRQRGIDVMTTQEAGMNASTDGAQLDFSIGQLLKRLSKLCFSVSAKEMKNRLEFLGSWR